MSWVGRAQSDSGTEQDQSDGDPWLIAVASALGGALLTLIGDRGWTMVQEKRSLRFMLGYLSTEVASIKGEAEQRCVRSMTGSFPFDAPLTTNAWTVVCDSSVSWRLVKRKTLFNELMQFYDSVGQANHKREVAVQMFALTQGAALEDDEASTYLSKAMHLMTEPYIDVVNKASTVLRHLPPTYTS